ncbi:glycosyltransferase family 2 protein, partial [Escherichia coli]
MPVYNVEKYIRAAITSILNQTYQNIELVIVDDASTDGTSLIID